MDLQARPFRAFVAVAEERSFGRAAARLNTSQPALSAQIRELERQLGFDLFSRTSRSVALTTEGRLFLGNARRMVGEADLVNAAAREIRTNQLRIGAAIHTVLIPERLALFEHFVARHPETPLRVSNHSDARHLAGLARREIDMLFVVQPDVRTLNSAARLDPAANEDLEALVLMTRQTGLRLPVHHPLSAYENIPREALSGISIAMLDRFHGVALVESIAAFFLEAGATLVKPPERNAVAVERYGAVRGMAAVTLGWFDPAHMGPAPQTVARPVDGLRVATSLSLLRPRGPQRLAADLFWNFARGDGVLAPQDLSQSAASKSGGAPNGVAASPEG